MSGAPRNPDKLNTIGIVVVGVCGAVLVYVSIVALQAFYMNDTSGVQTVADFGGQDSTLQSIKAAQTANLQGYGTVGDPQLEGDILKMEADLKKAAPGQATTDLQAKIAEAKSKRRYHIPIEVAMKDVVDTADSAAIIPGIRSDTPSVLPVFGRPKMIPIPAAAGAGSGAGSAAPAGSGSGSGSDAGSGSAAGAGSGSAAGAGSGSATATDVHQAAPPVSTGSTAGDSVPTAGSGPLPAGSINGTATGSAAVPPVNVVPAPAHAP